MRYAVFSALTALGLFIGSTTIVLADDEPQPFTANGTVLRIMDGQAEFLTSDLTGQPKIIWLDISMLHDLSGQQVANLKEQETVQVVLLEKPDNTFWAIQYAELAKGSKVNNTDWGVIEGYTTRDDSVEARVDNVGDDDEANAKDGALDNKGRRTNKDD